MINPQHINIKTPKIIVAVVVYNRFNNIERWIHCWKQCDQTNAELIVIHTGTADNIKKICNDAGIRYIRRKNGGYCVGTFQDVVKERLAGFPNDWDYIIWNTDDVMPMRKDFITPFIKKLKDPGVGISCMENSASVDPHVRTTGFCITKQISRKIKFNVDPVKTKSDCYFFEHRGGKLTLANQIRAMGLSCDMVTPKETSPLWDLGYWKRLDRMKEHQKVFGDQKKNDKVVFICPIYKMYPQIISSLLCQTHKNWELLLIHNGPLNKDKYDIPDDPRIRFIINPVETGNYGHPLRAWAISEIGEGRLSDAAYMVITNADNYYVPTFTEFLLSEFDKSFSAVAVYCSKMVHSYIKWEILPCRFEKGFIDCGGVMIKTDVACAVGWRDTKSHSSDWTFFSDIAERFNPYNFVKVPGCLFIHN